MASRVLTDHRDGGQLRDHPPRSRTRRPRSLRVGENRSGWLFATPWVVGFVLFTGGPIVAMFVISFLDWDIISPARWAGLENYRSLFQDPTFFNALRLTTIYAGVSVPLQTVVALVLALLLDNQVRGIGIYRTLFYLPTVIPIAAAAVIFRWTFDPDWGVLNHLLGLAHLPQPAWLASTTWALPALILMSLWNVGTGMVIFIAGLQGVPRELHEAASLDGAGYLRRVWHVTVPTLSPVILFQVMTSLITALQVFVQPYLMTQGGPGDSTRFFLLYIYENAFQFFDMGYASALSVALFVYIALLTVFTLRVTRNHVHYAAEARR